MGCSLILGDYNMRESALGSVSGNDDGGLDPAMAKVIVLPGQGRKNNVATGQFRKFLDRFFYLGMALLVAAVAIFGFSQTIGRNLLHPDTPRPWILPIHAIVFSSWVVLFITQSALVRVSRVAWHRRLGMFGAVLGGILPFLGVATALVMQHWLDQRQAADDVGLSLPFNDMLTFSIAFGLAVYWRRRPEFHRRLMLVATCCLTGAAFARFPISLIADYAFYPCVDLLILFGVWRDLVVNRRVHAVYRYALPCMVIAQALTEYLVLARPSPWLAITHQIMQWTA
jgi:uncharacterized membrane protein YozB (DUF420 family)